MYMRNPAEIRLDTEKPALLGVRQFLTQLKSDVDPSAQFTIKTKALLDILRKVNFNQCLVFSNFHSW